MTSNHFPPSKIKTFDLNVLFPIEVVQVIRELAKANDVSLSVVVRKAVAIGLKELTGSSVG